MFIRSNGAHPYPSVDRTISGNSNNERHMLRKKIRPKSIKNTKHLLEQLKPYQTCSTSTTLIPDNFPEIEYQKGKWRLRCKTQLLHVINPLDKSVRSNLIEEERKWNHQSTTTLFDQSKLSSSEEKVNFVNGMHEFLASILENATDDDNSTIPEENYSTSGETATTNTELVTNSNGKTNIQRSDISIEQDLDTISGNSTMLDSEMQNNILTGAGENSIASNDESENDFDDVSGDSESEKNAENSDSVAQDSSDEDVIAGVSDDESDEEKNNYMDGENSLSDDSMSDGSSGNDVVTDDSDSDVVTGDSDSNGVGESDYGEIDSDNEVSDVDSA